LCLNQSSTLAPDIVNLECDTNQNQIETYLQAMRRDDQLGKQQAKKFIR
jgi:hypothetical protein